MTNSKKNLVVHSIEDIEFDGYTSIPTILHYTLEQSEPLIGHSAWREKNSTSIINADFKLGIGQHRFDQKELRRLPTSGEYAKSLTEQGRDFLVQMFCELRNRRPEIMNSSVGVMVSEPLSLEGDNVSHDDSVPYRSKEWLRTYRSNIRRFLSDCGFSEVQFLPEPLAVYQYYRYGCNVPLLHEKKQTNALVIDFGGGTFDACVVSSMSEGDISQSGRNSKPLAASSIAVGGFEVNRQLVLALLRKQLGGGVAQADIKKGYRKFLDHIEGNVSRDDLHEKYKAFIDNFIQMTFDIEQPKIKLSGSIKKWAANDTLGSTVYLEAHSNPFVYNSPKIKISLTASEFYEVFKRMWDEKLKTVIVKTIERFRESGGGNFIDIILLSGGSANIGWLREELKKTTEQFATIPLITIEDFQQVVSRGLAIECCRRLYDHQKMGDFRGITYNQLCLLLTPDEHELETPRFIAVTDGLIGSDTHGVLLPSATQMEKFRNLSMLWRAKLTHPPRQKLAYQFRVSVAGSADTNSLLNVEEHFIRIKNSPPFANKIGVEVVVGDDGTASAKFILRHKTDRHPEASAPARKFFIDMTDMSLDESSSQYYLGLDFGTTNTAVAVVDTAKINYFESAVTDDQWLNLAELYQELPDILSLPLRDFCFASKPDQKVRPARLFLESAFMLMAIIIYMEHCDAKRAEPTRLLKSFSDDSVGRIWKFLKSELYPKTNNERPFSRPLLDVFTISAKIDHVVQSLSEEKHERLIHAA